MWAARRAMGWLCNMHLCACAPELLIPVPNPLEEIAPFPVSPTQYPAASNFCSDSLFAFFPVSFLRPSFMGGCRTHTHTHTHRPPTCMCSRPSFLAIPLPLKPDKGRENVAVSPGVSFPHCHARQYEVRVPGW